MKTFLILTALSIYGVVAFTCGGGFGQYVARRDLCIILATAPKTGLKCNSDLSVVAAEVSDLK